MSTRLFLDANVYLSFYVFAKDDIEELRKLEVLLRQKAVSLLLPEQVEDEFKRNRDGRIGESLGRVRNSTVKLELPSLATDYPKAEELKELKRRFHETREALVGEIREDALGAKLAADGIIEGLFRYATRIPETPEILDEARVRVEKGKPPGKRGSLGDALNWVSLLSNAEESADPFAPSDLHLVTGDRDFVSSVDETQIDPYLRVDWKGVEGSDVFLYRSLAEFTAKEVPEVKLARDLEKKLLIRRLGTSESFRETHDIISQLTGYSDFLVEERAELLQAVASNSQVSWIISDEDVKEFTQRLLQDDQDQLDPILVRSVWHLLASAL